MLEYLLRDDACGESRMPMEKVILRNCPKLSICQQQSFMQLQSSNMYRGTNFRGVSKNGRCNWQILTMIDGNKVYVGTVDSMHKAAILYDIVSIQTKGLKAKTNFIYRKHELLAVLNLKNLINIKEKIEESPEAENIEDTHTEVCISNHAENSMTYN